jgi:hypothetical protein
MTTVGLVSFASIVSANNPLLSKRSVINIGFISAFNYAFINHYLSGDGSTSMFGTSFATTTPTWMQVIDAQGWPNTPGVSGLSFGGSIRIPSSSNFSRNYVITWSGDGEVVIGGGTWSEVSLVNATRVSNGRYRNTAGLVPKITVTVSGLTSGPNLLGVQFLSTDPNSTGAYLKNFKFYRAADETDLLAGKIFRQAYKQYLVNLNPSALRFMDWLGGNRNLNNRFENRTLPGAGGYGSLTNWVASPAYGNATFTAANQYTLPAVSTGARQTTASMVHGEIATCRIGTGMVRAGARAIAAITNANPGQVTSFAHGLNSGDVMSIATSLAKLNLLPCTITVVDADHFTLGVDTTSFGTFTPIDTETGSTTSGGNTITGLPSTALINLNQGVAVTGPGIPPGTYVGSKTSSTIGMVDAFGNPVSATATGGGTFFFTKTFANQFATLQVGSGNDRTPYPVMFADGQTYASNFASAYIALHDYKTFYFDKTISGQNNSSGNPVFGVWIFNDLGAANGHDGNVPIEICTALVNEINALAISQGVSNPIHMWMNIPVWGLSSMDPDYSAASNWAVNAVDVVINPSSTIRTSGYSALVNNASLVVEDSNETWNTGGSAFSQTPYLAQRGFLRWPSTSSPSDFASMYSLRSTVMARDVKAAFPGNARLKFSLGAQGFPGYSNGNLNNLRAVGTTSYLTDSLVVSGSFGTPISNHDAMHHASYFDPPDSYFNTTTGTLCCTDDNAMFNGLDNRPNGGGNYLGAANPTQALTNFVAQVVSGSGQSCNGYCNPASPTAGLDQQFASAMVSFGKISIQYEGGTDWDPVRSGGAFQTFLTAAINSSQWSSAQIAYFNATSSLTGTGMPSVYLMISDGNGQGQPDQRWAYASPDAYASGTEGQALLNCPVWVAMGARNQALPN